LRSTGFSIYSNYSKHSELITNLSILSNLFSFSSKVETPIVGTGNSSVDKGLLEDSLSLNLEIVDLKNEPMLF